MSHDNWVLSVLWVLLGLTIILIGIFVGRNNDNENRNVVPEVTTEEKRLPVKPIVYELSHQYEKSAFQGAVLPWEIDQVEQLSRMDISRIALNGGAVIPWIAEWEKLDDAIRHGSIQSMARKVVCLVSDQYDRVKQTVNMIRHQGEWQGDVLLITTKSGMTQHLDFQKDFSELLDYVFCLDMIPLDRTSVSRSQRALFQQFKIYMFHPKIREMWDVLMYIDAGMHVVKPIYAIFEQEFWPRRFCAHSDSYIQYMWDLDTQFDHQPGDPEIPGGHLDYFQTTFAIFDVQKLCHQIVIDRLLELFREYPNHFNNEQSIMNLLLRPVWQPLTTDRNLIDAQGLIPYNFCQNDYSMARMFKKDCHQRQVLERIYVLSGMDPARRPRLEKEFAASHVASDLIDWVVWPNKPDFSETLRAQVLIATSDLKLGAACCVYKHYLCLQDMINKDREYAVIMEDNVTFDPTVNLMQRIERYIAELNQFYPDWDVLFDSSYLPVTEYVVESNRFVYPKSLAAQPGCGGASRVAQFYVLRKKAALKMVADYLPTDTTPDHLMNDLFRKHNMQVFWSQPPMVSTEQNHVSTQ
jgi:GR25 family glycosyltransferase involved in LPS biosynthesis